MIEQAIALLKNAGFDLTAREIAEMIWLAVHLDESEQPTVPEQKSSNTDQIITPLPEPQDTTSISPQPPEPSVPVYLSSPSSPGSTTTKTQDGVPIKVPAAIALRNSLALGRSLRPLMRKVPSPIRKILDEEATVRRIAEEKIWTPVVKPARERWLDLALVVEQTSSTAIWKQTITELQQLLKHHGAFRDVRTWGLRITEERIVDNHQEKIKINTQLLAQNSTGNFDSSPHHPKELIDPKNRRLVLLVSDCISPAWRKKFIYPVLKLWGQNGLLTILQLLPERLWERTALASEISVQLRSLTPGVFNSQLIVETWDEDETQQNKDKHEKKLETRFLQETGFLEPQLETEFLKPQRQYSKNSIPVPIITLEPDPLLNWSRVTAGMGSLGTAGFQFFPPDASKHNKTQQPTEEPQLNPSALVSRFRATASPLARRLAGLMAAAPVSLPVVHLIQQTLLPESAQIHVAEVFMSGLLKHSRDADYIEYEFIEGIRELLLGFIPPSKANSVLEKVSEFVAKRLGLQVNDFEALLHKPLSQTDENLATKIRPFAELKAQVLRQLGGKYAELAEELEKNLQPKGGKPSPQVLSTFSFETVTVNPRGEISKKETKQAQYFSQDLGNGSILEMVYIPGGTFTMGAPEDEEGSSDDERPQHRVTVQPFFMGKYPVTQAQWRAVAALPKVERDLKANPSRFKGDRLPVESVSWYDAVEFCARLSKYSEREYRLPSEAEWEYACRAGTMTPFNFGETITTDLANYQGTDNKEYNWKGSYGKGPLGVYRKKTTEVGIFPANAFGLHDMHGNAWEWCADSWHDNYRGAPNNGSAWNQGTENDNDNRKLLRGGSWYNYPDYCRSANRRRNTPDNDDCNFGFRVVCGGVAPRT
ncbi:MAG: formylglycine-generating enzyme family protein [Scytonema sp. PMC 1069.18]|nr:formylglycine-generating enzyme family protein [Scytonema sp. PMC 1069.18]